MPTNKTSRWYPKETAESEGLRRAYDTIYDLRDELTRVKVSLAALPTKADVNGSLTQAFKLVNNVPAFQLFTAGVSTGLNPQASISPIVVGAMAYTSTTTSITWWWDGTNGSTLLTLLWPDGSQTPIPPGSLPITGLTANRSYNFYPYYDFTLGMIKFAQVSGGVGTPSVAYGAAIPPAIPTGSIPAAAAQVADRHATVSSTGAIVGTTPAVGTGGGSGGGSGGGGGRPLY